SIAVERQQFGEPEAIEDREQEQWVFYWFPQRFRLFDQQLRLIEGRPRFRRRITLRVHESVCKTDLKLNLLAPLGGCWWDGGDLVESAGKLSRGLHKR